MTHDINRLMRWIEVVLIVAAVCTTALPLLYSFTLSWYKHDVSRGVMLQSISFALIVDITALFTFWRPDDILVLFWINAIAFTMIAVASAYLTWVVWNNNYRSHHPKEDNNDGASVYRIP